MRIGTWNLAGRWSQSHADFLMRLDCDVLLLTEVSERMDLRGYAAHLTQGLMAPERRWAGVFSRLDLKARPDPHPASAMADVAGKTYCSSILPWRASGNGDPWLNGGHADKTERTVSTLLQRLPSTGLVWGGDWNHALSGPEYAGSKGGREHLQTALASLGLIVPTADLPHHIDGLMSIDHIAVGESDEVMGKERHVATGGPNRLSDHDAYVVTTA